MAKWITLNAVIVSTNMIWPGSTYDDTITDVSVLTNAGIQLLPAEDATLAAAAAKVQALRLRGGNIEEAQRIMLAAAATSDQGEASGWYGDGSDGSVTYDGAATILGMAPVANVYTLTRDIVLLAAGVVNSGVTIKTAGFRIFCNGTLLNNGTVHYDGAAGALSVAGAAQSQASYGKPGTAGGAGGTNAVGAAGSNSASANDFNLGGAGGAGGQDGSVNAGGAAGTLSAATAAKGSPRFLPILVLGTNAQAGGSSFLAGGTGGGGGGGVDGSGVGGGGGAGGNCVVICAKRLINNGTIRAAGGAGAAGSGAHASGGGGGGGGGLVVIVSRTPPTGTGTITVPGGLGGAGNGAGVAGSNGAAGTVIQLAA